jgi:hypothetical protein
VTLTDRWPNVAAFDRVRALKCGATIAVFEATHRSVATILVTLLAPIAVLLLTPAIRPFRWSRLFWMYIVPVIPLATLFDGIVSCLRTYTPAELMALTEESMAIGGTRARREQTAECR